MTDIAWSLLPARSVMADLSNVMRGVASDESGGVGSSAISSMLYGIEDPFLTVCQLAKVSWSISGGVSE